MIIATFDRLSIILKKIKKSQTAQSWCLIKISALFPAGIYLLNVSNGNTRKRCEICSKLTIKIPEQRH